VSAYPASSAKWDWAAFPRCLAEAREKARAYRSKVEQGADPIAVRHRPVACSRRDHGARDQGESREPLDLRPYVGGTLEFDVEVDELAKGGVRAVVGCGEWCERSVNLIEPARAWAGKGRQHVALAMSCFVREGADFSKVRLPFALEGAGSGRVSVANVRITREAKVGLPCPDYRTESRSRRSSRPSRSRATGGCSCTSRSCRGEEPARRRRHAA
jgi:hypothetical protein